MKEHYTQAQLAKLLDVSQGEISMALYRVKPVGITEKVLDPMTGRIKVRPQRLYDRHAAGEALAAVFERSEERYLEKAAEWREKKEKAMALAEDTEYSL